MKLRKIRLKVLFFEGFIYRLHIIFFQSIFWYFFFGYTTNTWAWDWAISSSIAWNIVNVILYYNFHYWFARAFKMGDKKTYGKWKDIKWKK